MRMRIQKSKLTKALQYMYILKKNLYCEGDRAIEQVVQKCFGVSFPRDIQQSLEIILGNMLQGRMCVSKEVGLDDLQRSIPTSTFCDSLKRISCWFCFFVCLLSNVSGSKLHCKMILFTSVTEAFFFIQSNTVTAYISNLLLSHQPDDFSNWSYTPLLLIIGTKKLTEMSELYIYVNQSGRDST